MRLIPERGAVVYVAVGWMETVVRDAAARLRMTLATCSGVTARGHMLETQSSSIAGNSAANLNSFDDERR